MMLRTRITLIVTLSFVILAVGLVLESARQQAAVEARQAAAVISGDRAAWEALVAVEVQRLEGLATTLTRDEGLVLAVANAEPANIAATLSRLLGPGTPLASSDLGAEVMGPEGNRLYGSDTHGIGGGVFGPWLTRTLGNTTQVESGFLTPPGERPVIAAVSPLYGRRGLTGYVALYTSPEPVLARLGRSIGAEALLLTDAPAAQGNGADPRSAPSLGLQPEEDGRRVIQVRIPLLDRADRSAGTLVTLRDATASYRKERTVRNLNYGAILCVLLLLVGLLNWYLRTAFRPLNRVIGILATLARDQPAPAVEGPFAADEIGSLAATVEIFRRARQALMEARAAQARIESELAVARQIQLDAMPLAAVTADEADSVEVAAVLEPAREVGGDLYDVFTLEDGRLLFIIGDVSGKGVPAALIMVIVRTLVRIVARGTAYDLPEVMGAVNRFLAENNPHQMFVTAFAGILDAASGDVTCCDAGHPPPLVRGWDGRVREFAKRGGLVLGIDPDYTFRASRLHLEPGDTLILYTDGVSEAMNEQDVPFGTARIGTGLEVLPPDFSAADVTRALLEDVRRFAGRAPQSDDITLLVLRRRPDAEAGRGWVPGKAA